MINKYGFCWGYHEKTAQFKRVGESANHSPDSDRVQQDEQIGADNEIETSSQ